PARPQHSMCDDLDAVREARSVGAHPDQAVCHSKAGVCPFFDVCGYQRQKQQAGDVWFVPHELVFTTKPKAIPKVAFLVIDEAIWAKGLEGVDGPPVDVTIDTLAEDVAPHEGFDWRAAQRLRAAHTAVLNAFDKLPDGPLIRANLLAAGLNADTGR